MYKYETHLHTFPVSRCAVAGVRETLQFYKEMSYDGVFITNHFLDGNINADMNMPYEICVCYGRNIVECSGDDFIVVNGTGEDFIVVRANGDFKYTILDCKGTCIEREQHNKRYN